MNYNVLCDSPAKWWRRCQRRHTGGDRFMYGSRIGPSRLSYRNVKLCGASFNFKIYRWMMAYSYSRNNIQKRIWLFLHNYMSLTALSLKQVYVQYLFYLQIQIWALSDIQAQEQKGKKWQSKDQIQKKSVQEIKTV